MKTKKQSIKCNVHNCNNCDKEHDLCKLREIEIKTQCGCSDENKTICSNYEINKDL